MSKITDIISKGEFTFSLEISPEISVDLLESAYPQFFAVTWHAKSHQCRTLDIAPLKIATHLTAKGRNVLLHITCDMMRKSYLNDLLLFLQEKNIRNLFVILGESYDPNTSDFKSTKDLIRYIRGKTGNFFCIGVAGFPDCSGSRMLHLKQKIDAGSDFIITQAFFETDVYTSFVNRCRETHINVPIVPGIFIYETKQELMSFTSLCKVKISDATLDLIAHSEQRDSGREVVKKLMQEISASQTINHFHFFTLNKIEKVLRFLKK